MCWNALIKPCKAKVKLVLQTHVARIVQGSTMITFFTDFQSINENLLQVHTGIARVALGKKCCHRGWQVVGRVLCCSGSAMAIAYN